VSDIDLTNESKLYKLALVVKQITLSDVRLSAI
jgi:hypothetical protein